jgi:methanogenic corrinoid protein MtbC1
LTGALDRFDEPRAQSILDELFATFTLDALLTDVVLPYLNELGTRWRLGEASIAQEHFASGVLRGRLMGLARGWGLGQGPVAVLACLPAEQHDLGLIAFGLALRARGWRIVFLGSNTPLETVDEVSGAVGPRLVVLSAVTPERVRPVIDELRELASRHATALGGATAVDPALETTGVIPLRRDPVAEAVQVASRPQALT